MKKLPVGEIIRQGYAFTFGEIGTIIGLTWIPVVINTVAYFIVLHNFGETLFLLSLGVVPATVPPSFALIFLDIPIFLLTTAMVGVAITRQALGLRQGPAFAHFALGLAELRAFAGFMTAFIVSTLIQFALPALDAAGLGAAAGNANALAALRETVSLAASLLQIFLGVRLTFLLVASVVSEAGLGLRTSWRLTAGNFWRVFAVGLATLLPAGFLSLIIGAILLGPEYGQASAAMMQDPTHMEKYARMLARIMVDHTPQLLGLSLVLAPLLQGLLFAPAAFAYRALSVREET